MKAKKRERVDVRGVTEKVVRVCVCVCMCVSFVKVTLSFFVILVVMK